ncbi:MAG: type VI-D CRISPR-associated RNA-guided ribonuclease Cas13d [Planctomycetaceae bacterium]|jgi:hypothetical protein|nr:type VI-D CRISPR-associated RNA-guided ribonuclease Cas13d [Planctomycetaceae bacterium]
MSNNNNQKKTNAKRLGIKSVLLYGDAQIAITAFGKGNDARVAIKTDTTGSNLEQKDEERNITARKILSEGKKRGIDILGTVEGKPLEAIIANPAERAGEDYLKLKSQLEIEFFGREFPKDNIRIQIIYNILDIQKILGLYVTDIIYAVNNLRPNWKIKYKNDKGVEVTEEEPDIVGLGHKKQKAALQKMISYLGFFGEAFVIPPKEKKNKKDLVTNSDKIESAFNHNIRALGILGAVRQCTAHFKDSVAIFSSGEKLWKKLNIKKDVLVSRTYDTKGKPIDVLETIVDNLYRKRIDAINKDFLDHSKINLRILFKILNATHKEEDEHIIEEYFRFNILKEGKNLGVNMKHLREVMLFGKRIEENGVIRYEGGYQPEIKDTMHDSYRSKIYAITDFLLFREVKDSAELIKMVSALRETSDEAGKETLYQNFADAVWEKTKSLLVPFYKKFNGTFPAFDSEPLGYELDNEVSKLTRSNVPFVKLLSLLCNFLDGKEINELLSAYINKFENIQSFIDTLKELGKPVKFTDGYGLFNDNDCKRAGRIAQELRFLVSIGKMKGDMSDAKRELYKAAIKTLGCEDEFVKDNETFNKWLEANVLTGDKSKSKDINPFRNFIAGNVIESNRFQYLVRYTKPETVRALMQNKTIVRYVLSRIAMAGKSHDPNSIHSEQIDKYYKNLGLTENADLQGKIDALTNKLAGFSFNTFVNSKDKIIDASRNPGRKNVEIQQLKGLVGLYLTVAFIAVKNLVKTNARYYIAFAAFERDHEMFKQKLNIPKDGWKFGNYDNNFALTEYFLDKDDEKRYIPNPNLSDTENKKALFKFLDTRAGKWHYTKKWNEILRKNIAEAKDVHSTGWLLTQCRNHAEHLNVLTKLDQYVAEFAPSKMTSYFQLYHFVLQKILCEDKSLQLGDLPEKLNQYHSPCENFIKYAYVSLAYNLPRYKNLTTEALFDEDSESGKELAAKWKQKDEEKKK